MGVFLLLTLLAPGATAQDGEESDAPHVRVYKKVSPAVVYVEAGNQQGSGIIIDPSGLILTSPTACGAATLRVNVVLPGHRLLRGRVIGRCNEKELVLVKVDPEESLPAVELGDSASVRLGQVVYALGDSFHSIYNDGQAAISLGAVSGLYEVKKTRAGARYTGKVIETTAAVNPNKDGGALVDRQGRLLGMITLNYEDSRFTGLAIPIDKLRPHITRLRREHEEALAAAAALKKRGRAWLGCPELRPVKGGIEILRVSRNGPAGKAGLRKGDILTRFGSVRTITRAALEKAVSSAAPGDTIKLTLLRDGREVELKAELTRRPIY